MVGTFSQSLFPETKACSLQPGRLKSEELCQWDENPQSSKMLKSYQLVYIGLELVMAFLAVAGNILVCWAVCLNSNLQSVTNLFVVSLAVADIAVGLLAIPFAITIRYHPSSFGLQRSALVILGQV